MILLPRSVRVYVATAPVNLRKSFEGLSNEVRTVLAADPISGHVFLFLNRRGTQVKLLVWTRGGFTIVHKRLERGTFTFPARVVEIVPSVDAAARAGTVKIDLPSSSALRSGLFDCWRRTRIVSMVYRPSRGRRKQIGGKIE